MAPVLNPASSALAEIQGLYGAFSFPEKLLQKIWLRGDFNRALLATAQGQPVKVLHPGKWNLLGGPDFQGARLRFGDGPEVRGDVEVHLRAADWDAHGHARDGAYDDVLLHVVLFPPEARRVTLGSGGREIPIVALLPLLHHDLEEYAADEAVETLANRAATRIPEELGVLPPEQLTALLRRHAEARWNQKVRFARLRIERLGWEAACHYTALEILGYRFNRPPMLRVAGEWPLDAWTRGEIDVESVYANEAGQWSLQGVRPANHPRVRLRQYAQWTRERPDWPARVAALAAGWGKLPVETTTPEIRRRGAFASRREAIADQVCARAIAGTRLDTFICDGLLPLAAARTAGALAGAWFHWFAGDLPPVILTGLRSLGVLERRTQPACHGVAQGLLGWLLEKEASR